MRENVVPVWPVPSRDDLEPILRAGHKSTILEADEWRPLAQYVHDLCRACVKGAEERLGPQAVAMREALEMIVILRRSDDCRDGPNPPCECGDCSECVATAALATDAGAAYKAEHEALLEVFRWARLFADHECHCSLINGGRGPKCAPCQLRAAIAGLEEVHRTRTNTEAEGAR